MTEIYKVPHRVFLPLFFFKKNLSASRPSEHPPVRGGEMSKLLCGIIGYKDKTSSWHLIGFPVGSKMQRDDTLHRQREKNTGLKAPLGMVSARSPQTNK